MINNQTIKSVDKHQVKFRVEKISGYLLAEKL